VKPSFENAFTNQYRFEIPCYCGSPKKPLKEGVPYEKPCVLCDLCGGLIALNKAIIVKYGTAKYMREVFCLNCFHHRFPLWKQWLINHCSWFEKWFIARYFHEHFNQGPIYLRSEIFFGKSWFPNVVISSSYRGTVIAKNRREYRRKSKTDHEWLFENEAKSREEEV
jgi:hypothetical protein